MSFKSLLQNTIGRNASQYKVNKQTYLHSLYINTKTYKQIKLHAYTKRKREGHTNQNKGLISFQRIS